MGLTEIEAQAMSVPVVASNVAALNEIIENKKNGLLFEVCNEKELAENIELLFKHKEVRNFLISSGLQSAKKYELSKYINELNKIYNLK
jgi:glycosyltransferase involved in cell wall biosynthesis